jgi:hypothetical protein
MYVFGIDIPLMEILFVVFILNMIILLLMWYEMIEMRKLMKREELGIKRIDLSSKILEHFINENPSKTLIKYVYKYLEAGTPREEIKLALMKAGLYETTINRIFKEFDSDKKIHKKKSNKTK